MMSGLERRVQRRQQVGPICSVSHGDGLTSAELRPSGGAWAVCGTAPDGLAVPAHRQVTAVRGRGTVR